VAEAASAYIRALTPRIRLVNQQLKAAHRKLDELCDRLVPPAESEPGQRNEQHDVVILRSMRGLAWIVLAVLFSEAWQPLRGRSSDPVQRQVVCGRAPLRLQQTSGERALSLGPRRHPTRRDQPPAALRARDHSHGRALRTVADRLLSVACTLLERQTAFDPAYKLPQAAAA
jgi:hypothetical protein